MKYPETEPPSPGKQRDATYVEEDESADLQRDVSEVIYFGREVDTTQENTEGNKTRERVIG